MIKKLFRWMFGVEKMLQNCEERIAHHYAYIDSDAAREMCEKNNMTQDELRRRMDIFVIAYRVLASKI